MTAGTNAYELIVRQKGKINCKVGWQNIWLGMRVIERIWAGRGLDRWERPGFPPRAEALPCSKTCVPRSFSAASKSPSQNLDPAHRMLGGMAKNKDKTFEVACPDCGAMLKIDGDTGLVVSHTSAPRKRMFEDLETAAQAMREHGERTESIFRQSVDAEKNKADLLEKKFAEAMRKAKDAPEGKPLREIDLD
jgi:hypothetical protein